MQSGGADLASIARRLIEYADEPGISRQKEEDLRTAADALRHYNAVLNAKPAARQSN